jgi:hypothetical protein
MISDTALNHLADRFIELRLRALMDITFMEYLADPAGVEQTALYLVAGGEVVH